MITSMRRYRKALQIGLLVIIASFVGSLFVFGARNFGGGGGESQEWVAKVNGETIPVERYQRRYQAYLDAYSQIYRDKFSPEIAERLGLPQQVVNDLVQEALVVQRAKKEGLEVTDDELNAQIQAVPAFHESGKFSVKMYQEFLRRRGMSASTFENDVRRELTRMKVESIVKTGAKVSDPEVERAYAQQHDGVRAAWALVELPPLVSAATATDQEIDAYLKGHQAEFRQPDRRRVDYVMISPRDFVKPVSDADVDKYYKEHASEFEMPREAHVAHILARVPETGGSAAEDKAKAKIADVIRRVKAGESFAKLAKELSEDPGTAPNGGDLGFIKKGEVVPEFEKAAFQLKPGEITPAPVRTPFGYHAIMVSEVKDGGKKPLAAVAQQIRDTLSAETADRLARDKADAVRTQLLAASDFMAEAKKLGLTAAETKMSRAQTSTGLPRPDSMEETAFSLSIGGVSNPVKTPAGYVVIKVIEQIPSSVPPLAEIRDQVAAAVKRQKADGIALERAKQIAAQAKSSDVAAAAKKLGATSGETPAFSRAKPADRLPGDAMLAVLGLPKGGVTDPVRTPQGFYVLKVIDRVPADMTDLPKEKDKVVRELLAQKQGAAWESWLTSVRAKSTVQVSSRIGAPPRRG